REVEKTYPNVAKVLIDERNLYMAERLIELAKNNKDKKIVAVIGAGHEKGVKE
ncbi:MAG TPA: TraB family protein, partial [Halobacteria archaeon]|nr:TraB family protein [Halobacteria archaeon]